MQIPTKKLQNGFSMPVYGLGTWDMGGKEQPDTSQDDTVIAAIKTALDSGVTHIDTAEMYAAGHTEELVGKAIRNYDRKKLFLVSKVWKTHMEYDNLINACKQSLNRLQTDYLDLFLLHRYNSFVPLKESFNAMTTLVEEGFIKNVGVSNFNAAQLQEAQQTSKYPIVANQLHYNLQIREVEKKGVLEQCQQNDVFLIAWRPLQKGMIVEKNELMTTLCEKYKKTPAQIALNWLISQDRVVTLSKTLNPEHLRENLGALDWTMQDQDIELLRKQFPNQQEVSDAVALD
jgi:diketogulonate reductase-like aldo/keto reductase